MPISMSDAFLGPGGVQVNRTQSLPSFSGETQVVLGMSVTCGKCQDAVEAARKHRGWLGKFPGLCETKTVLNNEEALAGEILPVTGRGSEPAQNRGSERPA